MRITAELNNAYNEPEKVRALFSWLIGKDVDESFFMFPPFYTDFGKNITIGKNIFFNTGCTFQDRGGIVIGDGTQIGQNVVLSTLNHGFALDTGIQPILRLLLSEKMFGFVQTRPLCPE